MIGAKSCWQFGMVVLLALIAAIGTGFAQPVATDIDHTARPNRVPLRSSARQQAVRNPPETRWDGVRQQLASGGPILPPRAIALGCDQA